jgi:glycosyltransferase involved in cell wall biosynthesis
MVDGVRVLYFPHREYHKQLFPKLAYVSDSPGYLYAPGMARFLRSQMRDTDIVHSQLSYVFPTALAGKVATRRGVPYFHSARGCFDANNLSHRSAKKLLYIKAFELPSLRKATGLVALTEAEVEGYKSIGLQGPFHVIPNGVTLKDFRQEPSLGDAEMGVPQGAFVFLFMSRLREYKGVRKLLQAFVAAASEMPNAVLVIAGPDQGGLEAILREEAAASSFSDRIVFAGMISGERQRNLLARADVFCLPSDSEGFSMALLEAMASRTAVLASPMCNFPEIERAGAGLIREPSVESIGQGIRELYSRRDQLGEMANAGLHLVRRDFTWDSVVDRLEAMYKQAVKAK